MAGTGGRDGTRLGARLRYAFDNSVAAGPLALLGWLAVLSIVLIIVAGAVLALSGIAPEGGTPLAFGEAVWASLLRTLDGATLGGDAGWGFRAVMLVVTLGGIFIVSALIGVLAWGLAGRRDELRKGRSPVVETDHTIILNWSPAIFDLIAALAIANRSRRHPRIVVMAGRDTGEMAEEIARRAPNLGRTRIICRSGDPTDPDDLAITSPQSSRAIIVLAPEAGDADSRAVKTVLALVNDPRRGTAKYRIAAQLREARNAGLVRVAGVGEAQIVLADELIARLAVHASRQPGLSAVYTELLDFEGSAIYTLAQSAIEGSTFGDAMMAYDSATLIGVTDAEGKVWLNPPMESVIRPGMQAILIAKDESAIAVSASPLNVDHTAIALYRRQEQPAERTLMLGWNRRGPRIAFELSRHAAPGSVLTIAADTPELQDEVSTLMIAGSNLQVEYGIVDTTSRAALEGLDIASYDHVLVLGRSGHPDAQATDTRTLVTLLHLRRIAEDAGAPINVVSEMTDGRNCELARATGAGEFVVTSTFASLMLAQAGENGNMGAIFADLLDDQGSQIMLRRAESYLELGHPMTFYTVIEACRRRGEVALGHIRRRPGLELDEGSRPGSIVINPRKPEALTYEAGDQIIVLARH